MPTSYWVHDLSPFLIRFTDSFGIRYYGVAYLLGFLGAGLLLRAYAKASRSKLPAEKIADFIIAIVIGVMAGGRLGYFLFYTPETLLHSPLALLRIWEGGMASHGGFIGVALALAWFARKEKISFLHISDLIASVTALGLFFGRIANFINGELYGKIASVKWAVIFPSSAPEGTPFTLIAPRHPSQLYEATLEGLVMLIYMQLRFWRSDVVRAYPGQLASEFLLGYAAMRALGEVFREPDATPILGLSRGTFYSFFIILGGLAFIVAARRARSREMRLGPP
jgi:phosphatidylglycerol---prolipoprotein diacylglyceryl transferase